MGSILSTRIACVALCLAWLAPVHALAAPKDDDAVVAQARERVNAAKVHFKLGEFEAAIADWKEAYRLKSVPSILFNIAQAYRLVGNYKQSKFYYNNYLTDMPNAPNKDEVARQLEQLEQLIADEAKKGPSVAAGATPKPVEVAAAPSPLAPPSKAAPVAPVTPKAEPKAEPTAVVSAPPAPVATPVADAAVPEAAITLGTQNATEERSALPLVAGGAGAVAMVVGGVFWALASSGFSDATSKERPREELDAVLASADSNLTLARVCGGGGLVLVGVAAVTFAF